ncbi:MAG: bifunctional 4-hydroxy-2-oxoglutarate aldolase/2-dehydro-3-deoxy-phosphogluconate aldolase [Alphaproteobacteria bacterium]|nr:MAG: bifunctional 4-hydroxy-2-oxoglutarate aldolase/2-dehydro-3-deoxy-phosphogluconate aldolase [Alphaproteobacteria bacterium]
MTLIHELFPKKNPIPVVVLDDAADAVPLARALYAGGITSIEITLRTEAGLYAIERVARDVPNIIVGAGTITTPQQMDAARNAGAQFQVSPGFTARLADHAHRTDVTWLAGVTNASQIMHAIEYGATHLKFFPASLSGGVPMLKQFHSVFPHIRFCPTGGIDLSNLKEYAELLNVFAIGGSWLTPKDAMQSQDWGRIEALARQSVACLES